MAKFFIQNERYLEAISDMAEKVVEEKFGEAGMVWDGDNGYYTEEAQDFFNETYEEFEIIVQKTMGVFSADDLIPLIEINKITLG